MKVWIDQDLCNGDGLCEEIAPAVFTLLDDGLAYVKQDSNVNQRARRPRAAGRRAGRPRGCGRRGAEECPGECIFIELASDRSSGLERAAEQRPELLVGDGLGIAGSDAERSPATRELRVAACHKPAIAIGPPAETESRDSTPRGSAVAGLPGRPASRRRGPPRRRGARRGQWREAGRRGGAAGGMPSMYGTTPESTISRPVDAPS